MSHNQKGHVASNCDYPDLSNVMVTLRILTASCGTNMSASGMTLQERSCCTSFLSSSPMECSDAFSIKWQGHSNQWHYMTKNVILHLTDHLDIRNVMVLLTIPSASCDADADADTNDVTWPKKSCCTLFWSSWPKDCNGAINNALCITCCWCQCQWHHITKEIMLHLTSIILT